MQHPTTVIRAGRLIDGKSNAVQQDQAVFVEDGTITRVAAGAEIPPGADNLVDLSDATVLPGLIDCHVHLVFSGSDHPLGDLLVEDDQQIGRQALHPIPLLQGCPPVRERDTATVIFCPPLPIPQPLPPNPQYATICPSH